MESSTHYFLIDVQSLLMVWGVREVGGSRGSWTSGISGGGGSGGCGCSGVAAGGCCTALVGAGWLTELVRGMWGDVGGRAAFVVPEVDGVFPGGRPGGRPRLGWRAVSVRREQMIVCILNLLWYL